MTIRLLAVFSAILVFCSPCYGDLRSEFDAAYSKYQSDSESKQWELALESAELAYDLGESVFGKSSINTGNLAFNYAQLLNRLGRYDEAGPVLLIARKILQAQVTARES